MSLLGEIETIKGRMDVRGSVFFVSQEPWIFTATLKQNILFGKPFEQPKFDDVLKACCLDKVSCEILDKSSFNSQRIILYYD